MNLVACAIVLTSLASSPPPWARDEVWLSADETTLYGRGEGSSREVAARKALEEIATMLRVHIESRCIDELSEQSGGGSTESARWLARERTSAGITRELVVKRMLPQYADDPDFRTMLLDEARIVSRLSHPNIVQLYDAAEEGGELFLAMELVRGVVVSRIMRELERAGRSFPLLVAARIGADVARGLQHAHACKDELGRPLEIVHRDVSPQNVMISFDGVAKLLDFGVAKARGRATATAAGVVRGKPRYMSPEQIAANPVPIDGRSDVFSLGVVLWEICAGRRLFDRESDAAAVMVILSGERRELADVRKDVPLDLAAIIHRCLARRAEDRYATAGDLADELDRFIFRHTDDPRECDPGRFLGSLNAASNPAADDATASGELAPDPTLSASALVVAATPARTVTMPFAEPPITPPPPPPPRATWTIAHASATAIAVAILALGAAYGLMSAEGPIEAHPDAAIVLDAAPAPEPAPDAPASVPIAVEPDAGFPEDARASDDAAPPREIERPARPGAIAVSAELRGGGPVAAEVWLDGARVFGATPLRLEELPAREHLVRLRHGDQTIEKRVRVPSGRETKVRVTFEAR